MISKNIFTHAPTVQRGSQRHLFALAACVPQFFILLGDVKQAYTKTGDALKRPIFIQAPSILCYLRSLVFLLLAHCMTSQKPAFTC